MKSIDKTYKVLLNDLISVDFNDKFLKSIDKWKSHSNQYLQSQNALPHRAFSIFLFNKHNELLLQKRSSFKKTFPLCWTNTCCSHPNMVENTVNGAIEEQPIREALHRALIRELGLHIPDQEFYFMQKILYKKEGQGGIQSFGEFEVDYVFLTKLENQVYFKPVAEEIAEISWTKEAEFHGFVENIVKNGGYFSPWFLKMFQSGKLNKWWDMVAKNELKNFQGQNEHKVTNML